MDEGLLAGKYVAALENSNGTLYFGSGRANFLWGSQGFYYLREGGIWVAKNSGVAPKIFAVIDSQHQVTAPDLLDARLKQTDRASTEAGGAPPLVIGPLLNQAVLRAFMAEDDGQVWLYIPLNDGALAEKLNAIVGSQTTLR